MKPMCMDISEYRDWKAANESIVAKSGKARTPCHDCLADFALEMRFEGRCYAWNGTRMVLGRPRGYEDDDQVRLSRQQLGVIAARKKKNAVRAIAIREAARFTDMGLSIKEIARLMDVSHSTVSQYRRDRWKVEA